MLAQFAEDQGNQANPEALGAIVKASESYSIIASQDIVDIRGMKLWAKGQPVSAALQQRLLERKLQQPMEACLTVEDGVTLFSLHADLKACLEAETPLATALAPWATLLLGQLKQLPLHSVAQLMLTAALATRANTLPHAVQAMAMAGAIFASQKQSTTDIRLAMIGGLLHDLGEVYIQPQYLDYQGPMDLLSHKHMVVHPRMTQVLLSSTTDYPQLVCRAVGEHHERLDGTGYPARLVGGQISSLGHVLAVMEQTLGILRSPEAPLTRASFALRVVPGEFDTRWTGLICGAAGDANETVPAPGANTHATAASADMAEIDLRLQQAQQLGALLKSQGKDDEALALVDNALNRLNRLRVAWNSLGSWGLGDAALSPKEIFELGLAGSELRLRLRNLQRECLLLAERMDTNERTRIEPLWRGLLEADK
jgi:hypothetical protein